jgi:DNA-binding transcriptional regulator YhcF (GntR family)
MNNPGEYGYIKLFRKLIEWEWYDEPATKAVFIHCLLKANWIEKTWRGKEIKPGQFFTSIKNLAKDLGISEKQVRTALKRLEKTGEISTRGANDGTMITVCRYEGYQSSEKTKGKQKASEGQAKGDNEESKEGKEVLIREFEKFWSLYDKKQDRKKCFSKWKRLSQTDKEKIFQTVPAYIASTPDKQFRKNPLTYLNGEVWHDEETSSEPEKIDFLSYSPAGL